MIDDIEDQTIPENVMQSSWGNVYWFARILISSDKYGAVGRESKFLTEVCVALQQIIEDNAPLEDLKIKRAKNVIKALFERRFARKTGKTDRINLFLEDLFLKLDTIKDGRRES